MNKYSYNFQQFNTTRSLGDSIFNGKITLISKKKKHFKNISKFYNRVRPRAKADKKNSNTFESIKTLHDGRELVLKAFQSKKYKKYDKVI